MAGQRNCVASKVNIKGERIITSERRGRSSYQQLYMGRFVDIQTALKPLKKSEKLKYIFDACIRKKQQNHLDCNQFLFEQGFEVNKKLILLVKR